MTREERTSALANLRHVKRWNDKAGLADETIDTCIKALEQEPREDANANQHNSNELNDVGQRTNALEGDVISRQAVLDEISDYNNDLDYTTNELYDRIKRMSSVNPQYKECRTLDEFIEDSKESEE